MPFINITKSEKSSNKGSCNKLVNYLEKENKDQPIEQREFFFSATEPYVTANRVVDAIDNNKAKLKKTEAKFYLLNISPSREELEFINNDKDKLKAYAKEVMNLYAGNFGKDLKSEDLLWFAKVEQNRYYHQDDEEVEKGQHKQGEPKEGLNTHIQIIISRKCAENKLQLSPLTNHKDTKKGFVKGGFNRVVFQLKGIEKFDELFQYERKVNELERHQVMKYGTQDERIAYKMSEEERINPNTISKKVEIEPEQIIEKKQPNQSQQMGM